MTSPSVSVEAYSQLARIVLADQPLGATLTRIADLATAAIAGVTEASVTLISRGRAWTVAFSSGGHDAVALDERQYSSGKGPCLDAAVTGQVITIADTASETYYRDFARQAHRAGVRHTLSIPMSALHGTSGSLNLYGRDQGPFAESDRQSATSFADYATVALANAALYAGALDEIAQMRQAMSSRAIIEQAKGAIMGMRSCTADEAFDVLKDASSRTNRKLRDVAREIVETISSRQR